MYALPVRHASRLTNPHEGDTMECSFCGSQMEKRNRIEIEAFVRVLWHCTKCPSECWTFHKGYRNQPA